MQAEQCVLVVDDSAATRARLAAYLAQWGYKVLQAESGAAALEILGREAVDLVLSDWIMPGMDGLELCQKMRAQESAAYRYVILLTTKSEAEDLARGIAHGADDFLSKPVHAVELRARVVAGIRIVALHQRLREEEQRSRIALKTLEGLYNAINQDIKEAGRLQAQLLPSGQIQHSAYSAYIANSPLSHVGGDVAAVMPMGDAYIMVYAIDVSGHNLSSALFTVRLASFFKDHALHESTFGTRDAKGRFHPHPPDHVAALLNRRSFDEAETDFYFTMIYGVLNLKNGAFTYTRAGHPYPVLMREGRDQVLTTSNGPPIGLIESARFSSESMRLRPGDRLILHSDGATQNLLTELYQLITHQAELADLDALFQSYEASQEDDLSLLMLHYSGCVPEDAAL